jgi:hypothetical protein
MEIITFRLLLVVIGVIVTLAVFGHYFVVFNVILMNTLFNMSSSPEAKDTLQSLNWKTCNNIDDQVADDQNKWKHALALHLCQYTNEMFDVVIIVQSVSNHL